MNEIEKLAKEFGVDAISLKSFTQYFLNRVKNNAELHQMFRKQPELVLEFALKKWLEQSKKFYEELLEQKTPEAKKMYEEIATAVWEESQKRKKN